MGSDASFWTVDLSAGEVSHVSGFVARLVALPITEPDLRTLHAEGLVAVATARGADGTKWAVLANNDAVVVAAQWVGRGDDVNGSLDLHLARFAREAGNAWAKARARGIDYDQ